MKQKHPKIIIRLIRWVVKMIETYYQDVPLYAIANEDEPTAPGLLEHMGFSHLVSSSEGEVFQWRQQY